MREFKTSDERLVWELAKTWRATLVYPSKIPLKESQNLTVTSYSTAVIIRSNVIGFEGNLS
jgi:hypothetical protein